MDYVIHIGISFQLSLCCDILQIRRRQQICFQKKKNLNSNLNRFGNSLNMSRKSDLQRIERGWAVSWKKRHNKGNIKLRNHLKILHLYLFLNQSNLNVDSFFIVK